MAITILSVVLILATIVHFIHLPFWWIRVFDFPHLQIWVLGVIILIAAFFFRHSFSTVQKIILLALFLCVVYKTTKIYPYTFLAAKRSADAKNVDEKKAISILVSNVYMKNRKTTELLNQIRAYKPDVVLILEPDKWWEEQLSVIEKDYPHTTKEPLENTYGMLLYSSLPFVDSRVVFKVSDTIPSMRSLIKLRSGDVVELFSIHPTPPAPFQDTDERDAELLHYAEDAFESKYPCIVAGDLNDVAWSYTTDLFLKASQMLDPRIGRGFFNTFHAKVPFGRYPLDHIFHSEDFKLIEMKRLDYIHSDHFPVYIKLSLEPEGKTDHRLPDMPDEKEQKEIDEIINQEQKL